MKTAESKSTTAASHIHASEQTQPFFQKKGRDADLVDERTPFFSKRPTIQPKLTIGRPGDRCEQEADQVADQVVQRMTGSSVDAQRQNPTISLKPLPKTHTQRKCEECAQEDMLQKKEEEELPSMELRRKPIFDSDQEPPENPIQAKAASTPQTSSQMEHRLNQTKGKGSPLPKNTRGKMEGAFGTDFSGVRIHTDQSAVQMSRELGAQAFTHGSDIYFNSGKYNPDSTGGQTLLAHELTHTIQQNGDIQRHIIQRKPAQSASFVVGVPVDREMTAEQFKIYYVAWASNRPWWPEPKNLSKSEVAKYVKNNLHLFVGPWEVTTEDKEAKIKKVQQEVPVSQFIKETDTDTLSEPRMPSGRREGYEERKKKFDNYSKEQQQAINAAVDREYYEKTNIPKDNKIKKGEEGLSEIWLDIRDKMIAQHEFIKNLPPKVKNFFLPGEQKFEITMDDYEQLTRIANRILLSLTDEEAEEYINSNPKPAESLDQFEEAIEKFIKTKRAADKDDTNKRKSGSKYGWLGLLDLPQDIIDALEAILETLMDEEEVLAIRDTLENLTDLNKHMDTLKSWFEDPSKLIPVLLGLEDNTAIQAIEKWVSKPVKKTKFKNKQSKSKLISLAKKLIGMVEKLRRILKPIFSIRADFVNVFAAIAELIETVPAASFLIEKLTTAENISDIGEELIRDFTNGLVSRLQDEMDEVRKLFQLTPESFDETEFITSEDLAGALTHAVMKSIKHPAVKAASYIPGFEGLIEDNIVAPMVPKGVLESINGVVRDLVGPTVAKVSEAVSGDLEALLQEVEQPLITSIQNDIPSLIVNKKENTQASGPMSETSNSIAERHIHQSQGTQLPKSSQRELSNQMGYDFSPVRIHNTPAAHQASQLLQANAFTIGGEIFFGKNQYQTDTPAGKRLLAHELTHVVQQIHGHQTGIIQRDYKEYLDSLKGVLSKNVIKSLKPGKAPDPATKKEAEEIRDIIQKVAGGKGAKGKGVLIKKANNTYTFPYKKLIEKGYVLYKLDKKKIPTRIRKRRRFSDGNLLPSLTIKQNRIKLRAIEKPKSLGDAARKELRRNLVRSGECLNKSNKEAHHIVPLELRNSLEILQLAEKNKWNFNGASNGVCLGPSVHSGSHSIYTEQVRKTLKQIQATLIKKHGKVDWVKGEILFFNFLSDKKKELKKRRSKI